MLFCSGFFLTCFLWKFTTSARVSNDYLQRRSKIEEYKHRSYRGREMLMENLRRFHNREEPIPMTNPVNQANNFKIPEDAVAEVASYLSVKDLRKFGLVCRFANQIKAKTISHYLFNFNKYYVFEEHWFNDLIFNIIYKYFKSANVSPNLKSQKIYDFIEQMTFYAIKYSSVVKSQLPSNIWRSVLTFFHETIYGPGAFVPTNLTEWEYNFALKLDKYKNFPSTRGYYVGAIERRTQYDDSREERMHHLFNFLLQNTNFTQKVAYIQSRRGFYGGEESEFALFLKTDWSVPESLSEDEALQFMNTLAIFRICSNEIWSKLQSVSSLSPNVRDSAAQRLFLYSQFKHYKAFFKVCDLEVTDTLSYLRSRDLNHPFSVEEIQQFDDFDPDNILYDLQSVQLPYLIKLDIISKTIRSFEINFGLYLPVFSRDEISITELLLLERVPVLPAAYGPQMENFKPTEFSKNNPLAFLLHRFIYSLNQTPKIVGKYNLNVSYKFDLGISSSSERGLLSDIASVLEGKTLTFRQILYILRDIRNYRSYLSFAEELGFYRPEQFKESDDDIEFYPIYSVKEYLKNPNSII